MPIQCIVTKYLDQQENRTVVHSLVQKEDENLKDYEKLFRTNGFLEILIADVDHLLRSIECENGLSLDQPDQYQCDRGEISCENNPVDLQSTDCKNIPSSSQPNLSIKKGHIICENNHEDMLSTDCKISSDELDSCVKGQINCENNQENFLVSTDFKINPSSKKYDLSIKGQINCVNNQNDFLNTDCNTVSRSVKHDSNIKGQINFDNNQDNSLKIDCKTGSSSEQPDSNIKGQINFEIDQENSLKIDCKTGSSSEQSDSNIKGQINFQIDQENSLKIDCKTGSSSEQPDSNVKGQVNFENNQENLLKTDCKTTSDSKQPDLKIKCRIFYEYQDLESLNEYFEDVMENKEDTNIVFQIRSAEELSTTTNEEKSKCNFKYISKTINSLSMFCSFVGISLFGGIFFGLADVLEYRNIELLSECAHYMVISAVILFFLALLLSFFQEDSKENNPVVVHQTTVREKVSLENSYFASVDSDNKKLKADKLKCTKSNIEVKQGAMSETSKSTNVSSTTLKVDGTSKHEEIGSRTVPSNISKNPQHADTPNRKESKQNISSDISPRNPQHANTSKHGGITRTSASNISSKNLQPASSSKKRESGRTLSSNSSSETLQHANTSKQGKSAKASTKSQSLNLNKELPNVDKQLVPYHRQFENPSHGRYIPTVFSPPVPNFSSFMPRSALENRPTEEIIATKKMTIFPGGVAQEEYRVTRTAFYKCLWCPLGVNLDNPFCLAHRQSPEALLGPNRNNSWGPGANMSSASVSGPNVGNDNQWGPIGGISSQSALRPNFDSPCYSGGRISSESVLRADLDSSRFSRGGNSSQTALRPNLGSPRYSGGGISSQSAPRPNLDSPCYSGGGISSQSVLRQSLDSSWYSGTGMSFESVSRPNLDNRSDQHTASSLVLQQPLQNQVTDVRTKFESMNILP